jgi:hypothetical protein
MSQGVFTDKDRKPDEDEILEFLASRGRLWSGLLKFITENYHTEGEYKYYGKKAGWAFRVRKAGKSLLMLFFEDDGLKAQVVLNPEQTEKTLAAGLSEFTKKKLKEAKVYRDGRWLFINLKSERELEDLKKLLLAKRKPARK